MFAIILAALEAAAPAVLPSLFKALGEILASWLHGKVDAQQAIADMHKAIDDAGVAMASFDATLARQHVDFQTKLAAIAAMQSLQAAQATKTP